MSPGAWCCSGRHPSHRPYEGTTPSWLFHRPGLGRDPRGRHTKSLLGSWDGNGTKVPCLSAFSCILIPTKLHHSLPSFWGPTAGTPSASLFLGHTLSLLSTLTLWLLTADRYALGVCILCRSWGPGLLTGPSPSASLSLGPCSGTSCRS